jgi:hypothetical protein
MSTVDATTGRGRLPAKHVADAGVQSIKQFSRSDMSQADFFRGLPDRVLEATGATSGLIEVLHQPSMPDVERGRL